MPTFQEQLQEFNAKVKAWFGRTTAKIKDFATRMRGLTLEDIKEYFGQLNDNEKYGWVAEGTGFLMMIAGIVLFFF